MKTQEAFCSSSSSGLQCRSVMDISPRIPEKCEYGRKYVMLWSWEALTTSIRMLLLHVKSRLLDWDQAIILTPYAIGTGPQTIAMQLYIFTPTVLYSALLAKPVVLHILTPASFCL